MSQPASTRHDAAAPGPGPEHLTPDITIADPSAAYWAGQAILRLRRELAWCWHQRGESPAHPERLPEDRLPPFGDAAQDSVDLLRHDAAKKAFFANDLAARYLTRRIESSEVPTVTSAELGSWAWLAGRLGLSEAEQLVLGVALALRLDSALGPVCAACLNDRSRPYPTLALAQRLWDEPLALLGSAERSHVLYRLALLQCDNGGGELDWYAPLDMPAQLARWLCGERALAQFGLRTVDSGERVQLDALGKALGLRLAVPPEHLELVPLIGPPDCDAERSAAALAEIAERPCLTRSQAAATGPDFALNALRLAWLNGHDLLLGDVLSDNEAVKLIAAQFGPQAAFPLRVYLTLAHPDLAKLLPANLATPLLQLSSLDIAEREALLRDGLGSRGAARDAEIRDCARRIRLERKALERALAGLSHRRGALREGELTAACRNESQREFGGLAEPTAPRFTLEDLVLPPAVMKQFQEIQAAIRNLGKVHYDWGAAKAWSECGFALLFCGVPGTGKTMSAEVLSSELGLPLYKIDLSQVVNKYIGETEKNLKRIFDAAETSDCILFFDEADALFGKRTEVKDAHDRFANIEISYLLQRMERFRGVAILATNRRKDLDEAFIRRLRYVLEYPVPAAAEREAIWRRVFPPGVDCREIDFGYLGRQFQLTGGHIRSIAFNACLQAAERGVAGSGREKATLAMRDVLIAVKRELEKMNRTAGTELFGIYQGEIEDLVS